MLPMVYQYIRSTYAIASFLSNVRQEYIFRLFWNVARFAWANRCQKKLLLTLCQENGQELSPKMEK